jgi:hypothetical protein
VDAGQTDHSLSGCSQCCHSTFCAKLSDGGPRELVRRDHDKTYMTKFSVVGCLTLQEELLWCRLV